MYRAMKLGKVAIVSVMALGNSALRAQHETAGLAPEPNSPAVSSRSSIPLFQQAPGFKIQLSGDFPIPTTKKAGKLSYTLNNKIETLDVTFEQRGENRREKCKTFPPFKMELGKGAHTPLFRGADREWNFVTHCMDPPTEAANEKVMREYAIYRMLEASGLASLLTQLVDVEYSNPATGFKRNAKAFLVEHFNDASARLFKGGAKVSGPESSTVDLYIAEYLARNNDYSISTEGKGLVSGHNSAILKPRVKEGAVSEPGGVQVGYDFDQADLIDSSEPLPTEASISNWIWDRMVRSGEAEVKASLAKVVSHHAQMLEAVERCPIDRDGKNRMKTHINRFVEAARKRLQIQSLNRNN